MQATVNTQIVINARPDEVFIYLADLKRHYLWNPQVRSRSSKQMLKMSATYVSESQLFGVKLTSKNVVTKFDRPSALDIENTFGLVHYKAQFRLTDYEDKTRVKLSTILSSDSRAFAFTTPVLKQLALRELKTDLQALKIAAENNLQPEE